MADRLTQIQDMIGDLANYMCDAVGVLQGSAVAVDFDDSKPQELAEEPNCRLFAQYISQTAKDIEILINSLPDDESLQLEEHQRLLEELDDERAALAKTLESTVAEAETLNEEISKIISSIAQCQMESRPSC